jgi:hypothetical protein
MWVADGVAMLQDPGRAEVIRQLAGLKDVQVLWAMKYDSLACRIEPANLAVVTVGQILVPGKGEVAMK